MTSIVHVEVSGLTGSGKSAVMGEIEIALKALGLKVEHGADFQAEKNGTHADWQQALDLYQPTVVLAERNISRQPPAREDAQPVAGEPIRGEVSDEWADKFCEAVNWSPEGQECKTVEGQLRCVTFRDLAKGYILSAIATQPSNTHPAPDALRVAVEALTRTRRLVAEASESGFSDPDTVRALFVNNGAITQALAALQAEVTK